MTVQIARKSKKAASLQYIIEIFIIYHSTNESLSKILLKLWISEAADENEGLQEL